MGIADKAQSAIMSKMMEGAGINPQVLMQQVTDFVTAAQEMRAAQARIEAKLDLLLAKQDVLVFTNQPRFLETTS